MGARDGRKEDMGSWEPVAILQHNQEKHGHGMASQKACRWHGLLIWIE